MTPAIRCGKFHPAGGYDGYHVVTSCSFSSRKPSWPRHKQPCGSGLTAVRASDIQEASFLAAKAAGENVRYSYFQRDAEEQALVLSKLGLWDGAVTGQRPLDQGDLTNVIAKGESQVARKLFGRNSFDLSYLPLLKATSTSGLWPMVMSTNAKAHVNELPSLELCAAICTRILCVARRLRRARRNILVVLGLGSGDALLEASVALHLGQVLGQSVDLHGKALSLKYDPQFTILIVASDTQDQRARLVNRSAEVHAQMTVQKSDKNDAVSSFCAEGVPLYILCCWQPQCGNWRADIESHAGDCLEELCFIQPPCSMRENDTSPMKSDRLRLTEHFPKSLCRYDFLARGFADAGIEAGLFHSQLFILTPPEVPRPFLSSRITHERGSYDIHMEADAALRGVNDFHRVGLSHACCPQDLGNPLPSQVLEALKNELFFVMSSAAIHDYRQRLRNILQHAYGRAHKQLSLLIENSLQRMYSQAMPQGDDYFKGVLKDTLSVKDKAQAWQLPLQ